MYNDKLGKELAELANQAMKTGYTIKGVNEVEMPRAKGELDFFKKHGVQVVDDPEQDPENVRGKHQLLNPDPYAEDNQKYILKNERPSCIS